MGREGAIVSEAKTIIRTLETNCGVTLDESVLEMLRRKVPDEKGQVEVLKCLRGRVSRERVRNPSGLFTTLILAHINRLRRKRRPMARLRCKDVSPAVAALVEATKVDEDSVEMLFSRVKSKWERIHVLARLMDRMETTDVWNPSGLLTSLIITRYKRDGTPMGDSDGDDASSTGSWGEASRAPAGTQTPPRAPAGTQTPPKAPAGTQTPPKAPAKTQTPPKAEIWKWNLGAAERAKDWRSVVVSSPSAPPSRQTAVSKPLEAHPAWLDLTGAQHLVLQCKPHSEARALLDWVMCLDQAHRTGAMSLRLGGSTMGAPLLLPSAVSGGSGFAPPSLLFP